MSKFSSINLVNDWRKKFNRNKLPNWTQSSTVYYDKLSLYINSLGIVNYDFAMGAYLFELDLRTARELNSSYSKISDPNKKGILYEKYKDDYILKHIISDLALKQAIHTADRKEYDSLQTRVYGIDEWFSDENIAIEDNVLETNSYSKSRPSTFEKRIQETALRKYGSKLLVPNLIEI